MKILVLLRVLSGKIPILNNLNINNPSKNNPNGDIASIVSLDENGAYERKVLSFNKKIKAGLVAKLSNQQQGQDWVLINAKHVGGNWKVKYKLQRITFP